MLIKCLASSLPSLVLTLKEVGKGRECPSRAERKLVRRRAKSLSRSFLPQFPLLPRSPQQKGSAMTGQLDPITSHWLRGVTIHAYTKQFLGWIVLVQLNCCPLTSGKRRHCDPRFRHFHTSVIQCFLMWSRRGSVCLATDFPHAASHGRFKHHASACVRLPSRAQRVPHSSPHQAAIGIGFLSKFGAANWSLPNKPSPVGFASRRT